MVKVLLYNGKRRIETYAILDDGSERTILLHSAAHELGLQGPSEDLALRMIRQDISTVPGRSVSFSVSSAFHPQKRFRIHGAFTAIDLGLSKHSHPIDTLQKVYRHLRGPAKVLKHQSSTPQCLLTNTLTPSAELLSHVTRLWQMDVLPYQNEKLIIQSKQNTAAVRILEEKTIRVEVDGIQRYATPLLWKKNVPPFSTPKESVLGLLHGTEKHLSKNPAKAETYSQEIKKLLDAGYIKKLTSAESQASVSAWYIPHHMVRHNVKDRIVFNCSFAHQGASLNEHLLPGPTLGSTLLGVLLRFREYPIAVSSDIKGMFHQVRLLPEDKPFLRFLWRDTARSTSPGASCTKLAYAQKSGLRHTEHPEPTMRNIYRVLARQYDPLGLLIPYTTQAKILVQRLWSKKRDWDDPQLPTDLLQEWHAWESELHQLPAISLPRCYVSPETDFSTCTQSIHIFSDASEKAYGAVAYLRTVDHAGYIQVAFLAARSRVAPVRQQSIPRLELCAAHAGAQLAAVLRKELTLSISSITYWTDSTTVLTWLQSQSCRYKVFVGARVAGIQEMTEGSVWRTFSNFSELLEASVRARHGAATASNPTAEDYKQAELALFRKVESIVNSKPLGYTSSDVADPDPITPNMLLMGRPDPSTPQVIYSDIELLSCRRCKQCQALADQFWIHFIRNYLPSLQTRSKWQQERDDLTVGSIVLIVDQQLPRAMWPVGKVIAVIPGVDGRVRTAQIQVKDKSYTRSVARLIRLPAFPQDTPG
ncbi:hypothetical protein D5F01_LYC19167 [Larimichthys crocea]|uniref:DUF5641 domain-containing protein n=1 Tax=Larimichthys crocea TaxID=215358 RepID=A0A6G0HRG1_LARCR|nr:hypothetical protein D5F01_LYC19167 [Larimichthys crocea]